MSRKAEIEANFDSFTLGWKNDLRSSITTLEANRSTFLESYTRLVSLNAWKSNLLSSLASEESLLFFAEALNDALVSHVFASFGSWRSALTALRSCIENCLFFLYYKDHPVELQLWNSNKHKLGFTELHSYLEHHPSFISVSDKSITGLAGIKEEYATLSRAVHASAKHFRMSQDFHRVALWSPDAVNLGKWTTREKATLQNVNLLLLTVFRENLKGTSQLSLRKSLALVFTGTKTLKIKSNLGVIIPSI